MAEVLLSAEFEWERVSRKHLTARIVCLILLTWEHSKHATGCKDKSWPGDKREICGMDLRMGQCIKQSFEAERISKYVKCLINRLCRRLWMMDVCGNCYEKFCGCLGLEMTRRGWFQSFWPRFIISEQWKTQQACRSLTDRGLFLWHIAPDLNSFIISTDSYH